MLVFGWTVNETYGSSCANMVGFGVSAQKKKLFHQGFTLQQYFSSKINNIRYFLTVTFGRFLTATFGRFLTVTFGLDPKVQVIKESLFDLDCPIKSDNDTKQWQTLITNPGGVLWLT